MISLNKFSTVQLEKMFVCCQKRLFAEYMTVTADGFEYITEDEWPVLYLEGLLGDGDVIDPKHFKMISSLMGQLSEADNINFLNILKN